MSGFEFSRRSLASAAVRALTVGLASTDAIAKVAAPASSVHRLEKVPGSYASDHDIRKYGAVSGQDCTAAIEQAATTGAIYIPAGYWQYSGAGLDWASCQDLRGVGRGLSHIQLRKGKYLFRSKTATTKFYAGDLSIEGGAGAMRLDSEATNVGAVGMIVWERVDFFAYTQCAVSHQFKDSPNWTFRDCSFFAQDDNDSIGLLLSGDSANSLIDHCVFGNNQCHVKLASDNAGSDVTIRATDFIFNNARSSGGRTDLWIVPARPGVDSHPGAPLIDGCKFGSENRSSRDFAIVIADSASAFSAHPLVKKESVGEVRGLRIRNSILGANQPSTLIFSTAKRIPLLTIEDLTLQGALPKYLVEFLNTVGLASAIGQAYGRINGLINPDSGVRTPVRLQNGGYPLAATVSDPRGSISGAPSADGSVVGQSTHRRPLTFKPWLSPGLLTTIKRSHMELAEMKVQGGISGGANALYLFAPIRAARSAAWVRVTFQARIPSSRSTLELRIVLMGDAADAQHVLLLRSPTWMPYQVRFLAGGHGRQIVFSSSRPAASLLIRSLTVTEEYLP